MPSSCTKTSKMSLQQCWHPFLMMQLPAAYDFRFLCYGDTLVWPGLLGLLFKEPNSRLAVSGTC